MAQQHNSGGSPSRKLALCGILAGLSVVLLFAGGLIPGATYCTPLLAALVLIPVQLECGLRWGWLCWAASALLALAVGSDREAAFFYAFLGYAPLLRPAFQRLKSGLLRLIAKTAVFAAAIGAMYAMLYFLLRLDAVVEFLSASGWWLNFAFFAVLIFCMLLYDRALGPLTQLYCRRIRPKLRLYR